MAMKPCKECKQEISSSAKKCPSCGKDQRNWFMKHKILSFIGAVILLGIIGSALGGEGDDTDKLTSTEPTTTSTNVSSSTGTEPSTEPSTKLSTEPSTKPSSEPKATDAPKPTEVPKKTTYSNGKYLVGKDIESGLYKVTVTDKIMKMGYVERAKDVNMEFDSIIANIILTGNGYIEILSTDVAVKLQGVKIEPIKIEDLKPDIKKEASDGIYLIGYDLAPGTYKVEVTDTVTEMGYVQRSKSVAMGMDDIIANEIVQGSGYVKIEEGDFAVRLQGVKITLQ